MITYTSPGESPLHSQQGVNPNVHYLLKPPSRLYQVTQDGVLIARTDQLRAFDRHILQVSLPVKKKGLDKGCTQLNILTFYFFLFFIFFPLVLCSIMAAEL